ALAILWVVDRSRPAAASAQVVTPRTVDSSREYQASSGISMAGAENRPSSFNPTATSSAVPRQDPPRPAAQRQPPSPEDMRDYMHLTFQSQPLDAAWAKEAKGTIEGHLTKFATERSHVESISCRASLCEVKIVHDNNDEYMSFLNR